MGMGVVADDDVRSTSSSTTIGARCAGQVIRTLCAYDVRKWRNNVPMYARLCACIKTLIRAKAALNNLTPSNLAGRVEDSILHIAADKENLAAIKFLLKGKADVNACQTASGKTTLHLAAEARQAGMVHTLLKARANVNAVTEDFLDTPLHIAIKNRDLDCAKLLLKNKADINASNSVGTPLYWAEKIQECVRPLPQMIRLLEQQSRLQGKPLVREFKTARLIIPNGNEKKENEYKEGALTWVERIRATTRIIPEADTVVADGPPHDEHDNLSPASDADSEGHSEDDEEDLRFNIV